MLTKESRVRLTWKMDSYTMFHAIHEDMRIEIKSSKWAIYRDNELLDCYAYHSSPATHSELSAKVDAERYLNILIKSQSAPGTTLTA